MAAAKFIASGGVAGALELPDPVLAAPSFIILRLAASAELAIGVACFADTKARTKALLLGWLGVAFLIYRGGRLCAGAKVLCPCLGNLTDALKLSPRAADLIAKVVLAYILIGSSVVLVSLGRTRRKE